MKTLFLLGFIACFSLHFWLNSPNEETDTLSSKLSAINKQPFSKSPVVAASSLESSPDEKLNKAVTNEDILAEASDSVEASVDESQEQDDEFSMPWAEIEDGWRSELKMFLIKVDSERGEEIFNEYLEEKKKFAEKIGDTDTLEDGKEGSIFENRFQEIESAHQENIKEILGEFYSEIKTLHENYLDSVQYLNRSDVQFSMSI